MNTYWEPNPIDAGPWIYNENEKQWVEQNLVKDINWTNWPVRKINQDTTNVFFVDGFPRQATNTLRRLILECFHTVAIVHDIEHKLYPFELFTKQGEDCLLTIRDPLDAIASTHGYASTYGNAKFGIDNMEQLDFMIKYYMRMTSIAFQIKGITVVEFKDIVNYPHSLLLKIQKKFNLDSKNIESYVGQEKTKVYDKNHNFTQKQDVRDFLNSNITLLDGCYNIYNKASKEKI